MGKYSDFSTLRSRAAEGVQLSVENFSLHKAPPGKLQNVKGSRIGGLAKSRVVGLRRDLENPHKQYQCINTTSVIQSL